MIKILIVEDDAMIASGLSYALEQEGYEVKTADCVAEAPRSLTGKTFQWPFWILPCPTAQDMSYVN